MSDIASYGQQMEPPIETQLLEAYDLEAVLRRHYEKGIVELNSVYNARLTQLNIVLTRLHSKSFSAAQLPTYVVERFEKASEAERARFGIDLNNTDFHLSLEKSLFAILAVDETSRTLAGKDVAVVYGAVRTIEALVGTAGSRVDPHLVRKKQAISQRYHSQLDELRPKNYDVTTPSS